MSGMSWIRAGLEVGTYVNTLRAQQHLNDMHTAQEMEAARRALLDAMKSFIFDISRDIQLAEDHIDDHPQQVYIVARSLDWRLADSGLTDDMFPDFQDKEYYFKTQKKINQVISACKNALTLEELELSDRAISYINQMPLLKALIEHLTVTQSLRESGEEWKLLEKENRNRRLFMTLGVIGGIMMVCMGIPYFFQGLGLIFGGDIFSFIFGVILVGIVGVVGYGVFYALSRGNKKNENHDILKNQREGWVERRLSREQFDRAKSMFGELTLEGYENLARERTAFLFPLVGDDFQDGPSLLGGPI